VAALTTVDRRDQRQGRPFSEPSEPIDQFVAVLAALVRQAESMNRKELPSPLDQLNDPARPEKGRAAGRRR
jgi:hypothetical protein